MQDRNTVPVNFLFSLIYVSPTQTSLYSYRSLTEKWLAALYDIKAAGKLMKNTLHLTWMGCWLREAVSLAWLKYFVYEICWLRLVKAYFGLTDAFYNPVSIKSFMVRKRGYEKKGQIKPNVLLFTMDIISPVVGFLVFCVS